MSAISEKRSCQRAHPVLKSGEPCMTVVSDAENSQHDCAILDISSGGVLLKTDADIALDSHVDVGGVEADVIRCHDDEVAVAFSDTQQTIRMKTFAAGT